MGIQLKSDSVRAISTRCSVTSSTWPRVLPELTTEQQVIRDDFMKHWHEVLGKSPTYEMVERFNHGYVVKHSPTDFVTTLEIGAGLGEHLRYESLNDRQKDGYTALELRRNMVEELRQRFPAISAIQGDCQASLPFPDGYFDRILAIHVLEHLPDLPKCVAEMHRLCNKENGVFSVVIPCEGGLLYWLGRRLSAQRIFESRYKMPYRWFIEQEHLSTGPQVIEELKKLFVVQHIQYFPLGAKSYNLNLCIGLTLKPL